MTLNDTIDNIDVSRNIKSIYKSINKNRDRIDDVMNKTFIDLRSRFDDVKRNADTIFVPIKNKANLVEMQKETNDIINNNLNVIIGDIPELYPFIFKLIISQDKGISIIKKR